MTDKANRVKFIEMTFLVANISPEVVFGMFFLTLSSANVDFLDWELWWRTYTTSEALSTMRHIELVDKKEFAAIALDLEYENYIFHVGSVSSVVLPSSSPLELNIYPFCRLQISGFIVEKASTKVPNEYIKFADVFFPDLASELFEHTKINDHAIKLVNG